MVKIRRAQHGDATKVQDLLNQLGYVADIHFLTQRLLHMSKRRSDAVFVADLDCEVVGVMSLHVLDLFHQPGRLGRITSLVALAISASNELGEMQSGLAAAFLGPVGAVALGGAGAIVITAIWAVLFPELKRAKTFAPQYRQKEQVQ